MKLNPAQIKQITPFQLKVYEALLEVPEGKVTTYKLISDKIGCRSSQAIGQAMKRNPFAPEVPCHRVVKSDLSIGGFSGQVQGEKIDKKIHMLEEEGIKFHQDGNRLLIDDGCVYQF